MYSTLRLQFFLLDLYVIDCYLEKLMGLTNLKFSFNHTGMSTPEGADDRRFMIFFFSDLERNCVSGANKKIITNTIPTELTPTPDVPVDDSRMEKWCACTLFDEDDFTRKLVHNNKLFSYLLFHFLFLLYFLWMFFFYLPVHYTLCINAIDYFHTHSHI